MSVLTYQSLFKLAVPAVALAKAGSKDRGLFVFNELMMKKF